MTNLGAFIRQSLTIHIILTYECIKSLCAACGGSLFHLLLRKKGAYIYIYIYILAICYRTLHRYLFILFQWINIVAVVIVDIIAIGSFNQRQSSPNSFNPHAIPVMNLSKHDDSARIYADFQFHGLDINTRCVISSIGPLASIASHSYAGRHYYKLN